jgi:hypothetical protein
VLNSRLSAVFAVGLCTAVTACGSTEALSPASPSGFLRARTATITGRVTGVPVSATASATGARPMATTTITVTIVGTDITTSVDGSGNFELNGVPPGDVQLRFAGNGASATITLSGVAAGDRIHIVVSLSGSGARLEDEDRDHDDDDDGDDDEAEVEGVVSGRAGTCNSITFTVAGVTVVTNSATRFEDPCASIVNGTRVEVEGTRQANGSILASEVEIDD